MLAERPFNLHLINLRMRQTLPEENEINKSRIHEHAGAVTMDGFLAQSSVS